MIPPARTCCAGRFPPATPNIARSTASISGNMWSEQAEIAEHYRDAGHPQFWGRLAGTSGDDADAQWLLNKYRQIGLTDTRVQTDQLFRSAMVGPIMERRGDRRRQDNQPLVSAQPSYGSPATGGKELDLEVVYVGLGSEADFARPVTCAARPCCSSRPGPAIKPGRRIS